MHAIFALILGGGLRLTVMGTAIGLIGAVAVARLLGAFSPEFVGIDLSLAIAVPLFLISVAAFACWLPARRAMKVDPMIAARAE